MVQRIDGYLVVQNAILTAQTSAPTLSCLFQTVQALTKFAGVDSAITILSDKPDKSCS